MELAWCIRLFLNIVSHLMIVPQNIMFRRWSCMAVGLVSGLIQVTQTMPERSTARVKFEKKCRMRERRDWATADYFWFNFARGWVCASSRSVSGVPVSPMHLQVLDRVSNAKLQAQLLWVGTLHHFLDSLAWTRPSCAVLPQNSARSLEKLRNAASSLFSALLYMCIFQEYSRTPS